MGTKQIGIRHDIQINQLLVKLSLYNYIYNFRVQKWSADEYILVGKWKIHTDKEVHACQTETMEFAIVRTHIFFFINIFDFLWQ